MQKPPAEKTVSIKPYSIELTPTEKGLDIVAKVNKSPGSRDVTTYTIELPWNGWLPLLMKQLADVTARKMDLHVR